MRATFSQARQSRLARAVGLCQDNIPGIAEYVNEATQRLMGCGGEWGWWGTWDRVVFVASRANPYITLPLRYSRAVGLNYCRWPVRIQNGWFEVQDAGIGLRGPNECLDCCGPKEAYDRSNFPTATDISPSNQFLRIYPTDSADIGKHVLISNALDQNGNGIYTLSPSGRVNGFIMELNEPFTTTDFIVTSFKQVSKDITNGDVVLTQVDATSGAEVTLSRYSPDETNPAYRRYYLGSLPNTCCTPQAIPSLSAPVNVTATCQYEYSPVHTDTDQLIIGNIPALIEESMAIYYSSMDTPNAAGQEAKHHGKAVKLLQEELTRYLGNNMPAVNFAPFGTARLQHASIGLLT